MTFKEAISKTEEAETAFKIRKQAKRRLMRKVYRRVCKKINCDYCIVCDTCNFRYGLLRDSFRYAVKCITDADVVEVSEWSREES